MSETLTGRELDAAVARAVGLTMLGWRPAVLYDGEWMIDRGLEPPDSEQPIYLKRCVCEHRDDIPGDITLGHFFGCLRVVPFYSTDIAAAWPLVEMMVARLDYSSPLRIWEGPIFKPAHNYLDAPGAYYPIDTTCWYVLTEIDGLRQFHCAATAPEAIARAVLAALDQDRRGADGDG